MRPRYRIHFPSEDLTSLDQAKTYFLIEEDGEQQKILFHDYAAIYARPGLYEQLFYDRLKCNSPRKLAELLRATASGAGDDPSQMRVLDVGAGNGMVGELLAAQGVARLVGLDIIPEAAAATWRDRPGVYDAYEVADLTSIDSELHKDLVDWRFDAMTCVAALGFGDIPVPAFREAFNLIAEQGWVAINIKETFLAREDTSGFSRMMKRLIQEGYIDVYHLERYRHRLSIDGWPLYYFALIARKKRDIDDACVADL